MVRLVKEYLNEEFTESGDPLQDMEIGLEIITSKAQRILHKEWQESANNGYIVPVEEKIQDTENLFKNKKLNINDKIVQEFIYEIVANYVVKKLDANVKKYEKAKIEYQRSKDAEKKFKEKYGEDAWWANLDNYQDRYSQHLSNYYHKHGKYPGFAIWNGEGPIMKKQNNSFEQEMYYGKYIKKGINNLKKLTKLSDEKKKEFSKKYDKYIPLVKDYDNPY